MIQTNVLDCPSCGAGLLDPIYDLEMVDGGRRTRWPTPRWPPATV